MNGRLLTLALLILLPACVKNPATGKRQLSLLSREQEVALGKEAAEQVRQSIGLYPDDEVQTYVGRVGKALAAKSERPELPWSFQVVDDPAVNAFALPGGAIFVTRGILTHMNSEAELASVLGHEIGHVTAKHSVSAISRAQLAQVGLGLGSILSPTVARFGQLAGAGLQLLFLKYGRDAEREADALGFEYMLAQRYDVREMKDLFVTLGRVEKAAGAERLPNWLATHPAPEDRSRAADQRVQALEMEPSTLREGRAEFLAVLEGMVFGENPRQGYFQNTLFLHPELRFQLQFPTGWKTANQPGAVLGVSPQQDALVGLAVAGKLTPEAAAQKFFSQEGLRAAGGKPEGVPGVGGYFEARTEQGVVQGLSTFVAHGGATYQLLAYTPAGRLAAYDAAFRQSLGSFRELTDPAALAAQPARVALVKLSEPITLEQFAARYPSTIPLEELALINDVQKNTRLKAGRTLKRVVK